MSDDSVVSFKARDRFDESRFFREEVIRLREELAACKVRLAELDRLAHIDPLVELPNRRSFFANLNRLHAHIARYGGSAAMVFVDVDGLKAINDRLGHKAGDQVLVQVARLLVESVRASDFVARLSGDEFGILLEEADELSAWQSALRVVETVDDCHFCIDEVRVPLSVAVGVGMINGHDPVEEIIVRADREMYRIKAV